MFSALERMIAFRYLRDRKKEGFISLITALALVGIALGVAALIIVMSVMNGFRTELLGRVLGINGHIAIVGYQGIDGFDTLAQRVSKVPEVVSATPYIEGQALASSRSNAQGAMIKGIRQKDLKAKKLIADHMVDGNLEDFTGSDTVVMGSRIAYALGLSVGNSVTLVSPQGNATVIGMVPRLKTYRIVGLFEMGMSEYDNLIIFMPLESAQLFFKLPNKVSGLELMTKDMNRAPAIARDIENLLQNAYHVEDWQQTNGHFFNALIVERNVMFLILTLIIGVAGLNIISSMLMLVKVKTRDIAVLRTMGATRGMVMRVFFIAGASVGVIGTIAGVALGIGFAANIERIRQFIQSLTGSKLFDPVVYFLSVLPSEIRPGDIIFIVTISLSISFLATIYPVRKAAKQDPAQVLRYE